MADPAQSDRSSGDPRDREAFLDLLAAHEAQLLGFLCAIVRNYQDAEDLFQQSVLTMWKKFDSFEANTNFVGWGCRIARNHAMNLGQARRAIPLSDEVLELLTVEQEAEEPELRIARRRALSRCIDKLSAKDRVLVDAAYNSDQSIQMVAEHLGRSAAGVYNSLSRIRSALYRCIQATIAQEAAN